MDPYERRGATDLPFRHCPQGLDDGQLHIQVGRLLQESHHHLDHPRNRLLQLGMFLGEEEDLFVEETPVAGVLAQCDDGDKQAGGGRQIRSLIIVSKVYQREGKDDVWRSPVALASPEPGVYRWHPAHRSID